jgi:formate hydrogenlyase subunit 6/NADH:ubiquinone oxidoreductase subunit I
MIERIDESCSGCGMCVAACPMDVIRMEKVGKKKRAAIRYRLDCMSCYNCEEDCPVPGTIFVTPERSPWVKLPW